MLDVLPKNYLTGFMADLMAKDLNLAMSAGGNIVQQLRWGWAGSLYQQYVTGRGR